MRVGVFGGTFNPIHAAHIHLANEFFTRLELDRLTFVPTYTPPHKPAENLITAEHRLAMCRIIAKKHRRFTVCGYEIAKQGKSYTCKTLDYLQRLYFGADLYLLTGADMFLTLQDWKNPEEIFKLATICAVQREPGELEAILAHEKTLEGMGAHCLVLPMEPMPLSSTQIREVLRSGGDVSDWLDPDVLQYINENGLYR